jgi:hypothetical protein
MDATEDFTKPEWEAGVKSDPISHTKNHHIHVDIGVRFTVTPENETASLTMIRGDSTDGDHFVFKFPVSRSVSNQSVPFPNLVSKGTLPNMVTAVTGSIHWTATIDGQTVDLGNTGPHKVYVTLEKPDGKMLCPEDNKFAETGPLQDVTESRLLWAVEAAEGTGTSSEKECVDAIFLALKRNGVGYTLGRRWVADVNTTGMTPKPTLHHYLWACNTNNAQGECHNIAAAFVLACRILGVKKTFEINYMFPWPSRDEIHPTYPKSARRSAGGKRVLGKYNARYTRVHSGEGHASEALLFLDGSEMANNFEGVARYDQTALYAIGDDVFDQFAHVNDNASSYFAMRENTDGLRASILDMNQGWAKLVFSGPDEFCDKPYPWKDSRDFKWQD